MKNINPQQAQSTFTLIELLISNIIIAILAAIISPILALAGLHAPQMLELMA